MDSLKFIKGLEENLPSILEKDAFYVTTDSKKIRMNDAVWENSEDIKNEIYNVLDENETVTAAALVDFNERIEELEQMIESGGDSANVELPSGKMLQITSNGDGGYELIIPDGDEIFDWDTRVIVDMDTGSVGIAQMGVTDVDENPKGLVIFFKDKVVTFVPTENGWEFATEQVHPQAEATTSISGFINLSDSNAVDRAQKALTKTNEIAYYIISDNEGKIPSKQTCYAVPSSIATQLGLKSPDTLTNLAISATGRQLDGFGVNVGDMIALTRVKVKISDISNAFDINLNLSGEVELYQYRILSSNDAKPYWHNGIETGVQGLMSPWDKTQVNKISGIENSIRGLLPKTDAFPSRWAASLNDARETGVYPWCTEDIPPFCAGAFTCITQKTSTDDGAYHTIEQTVYGRQGEHEGKIFQRIIFDKSDGTDTQFGPWKVIDNIGAKATNMLHCIVEGDYVEPINPLQGPGVSVIVDNGNEYHYPSYCLLDSSLFMTIIFGIDKTIYVEYNLETNEFGIEEMPNGGVTKEYVDEALANISISDEALNGKQDTLVSGINIRTINGQSLLGSGNLYIDSESGLANVAAVNDEGELEDIDGKYIQYTHQNLTEAEKEQARNNIGISEFVSTKVKKEVVNINTDTVALEADKYYINTATHERMTITMVDNDKQDSYLKEYCIEFTTSPNGTSVSLPSGIKWVGGIMPMFENNCTYQISIMNNLGICTKFN